MTGTVAEEPAWSLERRESSGHLVWRKEAPNSKVRFRFDVEVLEFEKHPNEDKHHDEMEHFKFENIPTSIVYCATFVAGIAVTILLPWYLIATH